MTKAEQLRRWPAVRAGLAAGSGVDAAIWLLCAGCDAEDTSYFTRPAGASVSLTKRDATDD